jgi:hypothetical protein
MRRWRANNSTPCWSRAILMPTVGPRLMNSSMDSSLIEYHTLWLPGNHDDGSAQQGVYRDHLKRRIIGRHWDVLMLETQVAGKVGGYFFSAELEALRREVADAAAGGKSLLIATHHPLRTLQSAWLDQQAVSNASAALSIMQTLSNGSSVVTCIKRVTPWSVVSECLRPLPRASNLRLGPKILPWTISSRVIGALFCSPMVTLRLKYYAFVMRRTVLSRVPRVIISRTWH